ncbi:hypothetical protein HUT18_14295 [Streptomyces sp. NA04227]|uniref:hypothetical protein n=1 Tax=Streptomyces sp. NA04227 TaxID=2742136 RepID=UPI0015914C68|nr:hypothetical protein [Streptomyces sp. NA04227]QKW07383.1 hypothetical protein HUT18_14295 [Streptomyces sp. NA04227]
MTLSISAVVLFGIFVALLIRFKAVGAGAAVVVLLFGFYLARTDAADSIDRVMASLAETVRDINA